MFRVEHLPNGNLKLLATNEARRWIKERQELECDSDTILVEGTEPLWTNGGYEPFFAGDANPFVGLTCAPCIAEAMDHEDDGQRSIVGRFWYFQAYQLRDPMEVLKRTGKVIFNIAH
jgi:hypothetical protein